jgi:hypothetical protein
MSDNQLLHYYLILPMLVLAKRATKFVGLSTILPYSSLQASAHITLFEVQSRALSNDVSLQCQVNLTRVCQCYSSTGHSRKMGL